MKRERRWRLFGPAIVALLVWVAAGQAGGIDTTPTGTWRAEAWGQAGVEPYLGSNSVGATGALSLRLLNEWRPDEQGYLHASAPPDALKLTSILTVAVPDGNTAFLPVTLGLSFSFTQNEPAGPFLVTLGGDASVLVEVPLDDDYFAQVSTTAIANTDADADLVSDGFYTGVGASAEAQSAASAPGDGSVLPAFFTQAWGIFSATRFLLDDNLLAEQSTAWGRDPHGNSFADGVDSTLPVGPLEPGETYFAVPSGTIEQLEIPEGTHFLRIEQFLWGFVETHAGTVLIPEPGTSVLLSLGLIGLCWRQRRRARARR